VEENCLIQSLQNKKLYVHSIKKFKVHETHISWVLLTGFFAYKIKKPVNLGFVDYTSLEKRRFFCEEEYRLNQILAPDLYQRSLPIYGSNEHPNWTGEGNIIEYAVLMHQFSEQNLFANLIKKKKLTENMMFDIANQIGRFHLKTSQSELDSPFGSLSQIKQSMLDNFHDCRKILENRLKKRDVGSLEPDLAGNLAHDPTHEFDHNFANDFANDLENDDRLTNDFTHDLADLDWIKDISLRLYEQKKSLFQLRKDQGFIRDCHGDLHLGNIVLFNKKITIFDRIEFNKDFRFIDTMNEIAFLIMNLEEEHEQALGQYFLNHYLEITGDFEGLSVLPFYKMYRAMVRAKVALESPIKNATSLFRHHLHYAKNLALQLFGEKSENELIITFGVSGSGKTFISKKLAAHLPAIHIRSDIERKRLFLDHAMNRDFFFNEKANNDKSAGYKAEITTPKLTTMELTKTEFMTTEFTSTELYTQDKTEKTYQRLHELSDFLLKSGYSVIVDAAFLKENERTTFHALANKHQVPFFILHCHASKALLSKRIKKRLKQTHDASDATLEVLKVQLENKEPLTKKEKAFMLDVGP
jgi:uncharacterized protein